MKQSLFNHLNIKFVNAPRYNDDSWLVFRLYFTRINLILDNLWLKTRVPMVTLYERSFHNRQVHLFPAKCREKCHLEEQQLRRRHNQQGWDSAVECKILITVLVDIIRRKALLLKRLFQRWFEKHKIKRSTKTGKSAFRARGWCWPRRSTSETCWSTPAFWSRVKSRARANSKRQESIRTGQHCSFQLQHEWISKRHPRWSFRHSLSTQG